MQIPGSRKKRKAAIGCMLLTSSRHWKSTTKKPEIFDLIRPSYDVHNFLLGTHHSSTCFGLRYWSIWAKRWRSVLLDLFTFSISCRKKRASFLVFLRKWGRALVSLLLRMHTFFFLLFIALHCTAWTLESFSLRHQRRRLERRETLLRAFVYCEQDRAFIIGREKWCSYSLLVHRDHFPIPYSPGVIL